MSAMGYRLGFLIVGLLPFIGIALIGYYNVERKLPIYPAVTIQSGIEPRLSIGTRVDLVAEGEQIWVRATSQ